MHKSNSPHLPSMSGAFYTALQSMQNDPLFSIPPDVRATIARNGKMTKVVLLGTQGLGKYLLDIVASKRHCDVIAVVDDPLSERESTYRNLPLLTTSDFLALSRQIRDLVAINTCGHEKPKQFFTRICHDNGIACINFEQAIRAFGLHGKLDCRVEDWGPEIARNATRLEALGKRMADNQSVTTLHALLTHYLTCDPSYLQAVQLPYSSLYFGSGLLDFGNQEKMVDCGASIGESLQGLIKHTQGEFSHSWIIEPDRNNLAILQAIIDGYQGTALENRISLHACGVGETAQQVCFTHEGGHGSSIITDSTVDEVNMIEIRPVDDIIDDAPTFLKMDIEGSELPALKGARHTITTHKPKLAISAYHRSMDLLDLTDYVLSLRPDYRVGLRHHTPFRWDTCLYFY